MKELEKAIEQLEEYIEKRSRRCYNRTIKSCDKETEIVHG